MSLGCGCNTAYLVNRRETRRGSDGAIKQSIIIRHEGSSNHYSHKSNISGAVNHSEYRDDEKLSAKCFSHCFSY